MSTENEGKLIGIPVKIPLDLAVPGAQFDLQNGRVMELLTISDDKIDIEWKEVPHPITEVVTGWLTKAGKEQSRAVEQIVKSMIVLAATCPNMPMKDFWPYLVKAFPVQATTIVTRAQLGLDLDSVEEKELNGAYSQTNGEQVIVNLQPKIFMPEVKKEAPPVINFNPQINVPKQDAPIVNVNPNITLDVPPVETETISIERDSSGFIQEATKVRRRGKQAAPA